VVFNNDTTTIDTGDGNDTITGITQARWEFQATVPLLRLEAQRYGTGLTDKLLTSPPLLLVMVNLLVTSTIIGALLNTSGTGSHHAETIDTGGGDIITGTTLWLRQTINSSSAITTGDGNDIINGRVTPPQRDPK